MNTFLPLSIRLLTRPKEANKHETSKTHTFSLQLPIYRLVTGQYVFFDSRPGCSILTPLDHVQDFCVTPTSCTRGTGNRKSEFLLLRPGS
jgi:hypothetical protein